MSSQKYHPETTTRGSFNSKLNVYLRLSYHLQNVESDELRKKKLVENAIKNHKERQKSLKHHNKSD